MATLKYRNSAVGELARQLAMSPRHLRKRQIAGIDALLELAQPAKSYPFELVRFHLTGTRPSKQDDTPPVSTDELVVDLPVLAEHITRKSAIPQDQLDGEYLSLDAIGVELKVSTKTIRRWRSRGLVGVRVTGDDGVSRLFFSRKGIDRFVDRNRAMVERGASFRLLTEGEKQNIVETARALLTERRRKLHIVARAVAAKTGRAIETVRYTLRQYDAAHPETALFARNGEPVVSKRHLAIWRCRRNGESIEQIAAAFDADSATIESILRELEIRRIKSETWEYVDNELFHAPDAESLILGMPRPAAPAGEAKKVRAPRDLPAYLKSLYDNPVLSREQEADLFRRYNFERFRLAACAERLNPCTATARDLEAFMRLRGSVETLKNEIVQANLRLVVSIAKRHVARSANFFEVVSDGNISLMRAVEKFDYSMGNKFSTYATWSIMKNYARSIPESHYHMRRYVTGQDELLGAAADTTATQHSPSDLESVRAALTEGMEQLTERERTIVREHFGLIDPNGVGATLEDLGKRFGVTKERVRQIEQRAIGKLRELISPTLMEAFAD